MQRIVEINLNIVSAGGLSIDVLKVGKLKLVSARHATLSTSKDCHADHGKSPVWDFLTWINC